MHQQIPKIHRQAVFWAVLSVASACTTVGTVSPRPDTAVAILGAPAPTPTWSQTPGLVSQPGLVAVIPFTLNDLPTISEPLFSATIDGHAGTFGLDLGNPWGTVNRSYLQLDATGGLDTVLAGEPMPDSGALAAVTMRLGTLQSPHPIRATVQMDAYATQADHRLGNIGLNALEPFEAIIDYTHFRLILIRLDSTGHRLAHVPAYTPRTTMPLIAVDHGHWAVQGRIGTVVDTLALDSGNPVPIVLTDATRTRVQDHITNGKLDHIVVGAYTMDSLIIAPAFPYMPDILGYPVLRQFGAIGMNQRTHQLVLYQ